MSTVLKLLHHGLSVKDHIVAEEFPMEELARSPLGQGLGDGSDWQESASHMEREMADLTAPLYLAGRATSSLDLAHELVARQEFPVWSSVLVLQQSAGRGQMRREWVSPPGNIYAALRLPMTAPFASEAAAPALGVFVAHALESLGFPVGLKWPNDILQVSLEKFSQEYSRGGWNAGSVPPTAWRKAGGILLEERNGALIAGIGLNLDSCPDTSRLREGFVLAAGRLMSALASSAMTSREGTDGEISEQCGTAKKIDSKQEKTSANNANLSLVPLWSQLVKNIILCYSSSDYNVDQTMWLSLAQKFLAFKGWQVRLDDAVPEDFQDLQKSENQTVIGWMEGLCPSGALRLRTENGLRTFFGGSLTPLP